jgi:hypothetical protein
METRGNNRTMSHHLNMCTKFFRLPRELRNAVYGYVWQSTPNLTIQHSPMELYASYTASSGSELPLYGLPAWLLTNKQVLSEGFAQLATHASWSCKPVACAYQQAIQFHRALPALVLPIKHYKPLVITLNVEIPLGRWADLISLNPTFEHLENIGNFISDCTDTKKLEINLTLGDLPCVTQRYMLYKLELYVQTSSRWNLDLTQVTITLRSKRHTRNQQYSTFRTGLIKSLEDAGRVMCGTQGVTHSFEVLVSASLITATLGVDVGFFHQPLVTGWRYTAVKKGQLNGVQGREELNAQTNERNQDPLEGRAI